MERWGGCSTEPPYKWMRGIMDGGRDDKGGGIIKMEV